MEDLKWAISEIKRLTQLVNKLTAENNKLKDLANNHALLIDKVTNIAKGNMKDVMQITKSLQSIRILKRD
jgi:KaiC/GvpD/RAD55 family RecA-like ATPase